MCRLQVPRLSGGAGTYVAGWRSGRYARRRRADRTGGQTSPKTLKPADSPPNPYVPAAPLSLADAASQLGIRPVLLAQAIREGKVATIHGRGGEQLVAREE